MWSAGAVNALAEQTERLVALFAALGDPVRLELVLLVHNQARPAGDLAGVMDLAASTVSHHLRMLVRAGVLSEERRGRERWYRLQPAVAEVLEAARV
jgi:DNA-binding transcriptional ArsR family regulator